MAFIASTVTLQSGFSALLSVALQQKTYLQNWAARLASNITALDGVEISSSIARAVALMDTYAALPGMAAYAQAQFNNAGYNVVNEYAAMKTALLAVKSWLDTNIPANSVSVSNGAVVGQTFTPAATAPLLALVNAASATIA